MSKGSSLSDRGHGGEHLQFLVGESLSHSQAL
jgi:hypothetical protein